MFGIFMVCEHCTKVADVLTKRNSAEYKEWKETDDYKEWLHYNENGSVCGAVKKIDCIQHVGKCFCRKVEDIRRKGGKVVDGKSMNRMSID